MVGGGAAAGSRRRAAAAAAPSQCALSAHQWVGKQVQAACRRRVIRVEGIRAHEKATHKRDHGNGSSCCDELVSGPWPCPNPQSCQGAGCPKKQPDAYPQHGQVSSGVRSICPLRGAHNGEDTATRKKTACKHLPCVRVARPCGAAKGKRHAGIRVYAAAPAQKTGAGNSAKAAEGLLPQPAGSTQGQPNVTKPHAQPVIRLGGRAWAPYFAAATTTRMHTRQNSATAGGGVATGVASGLHKTTASAR